MGVVGYYSEKKVPFVLKNVVPVEWTTRKQFCPYIYRYIHIYTHAHTHTKRNAAKAPLIRAKPSCEKNWKAQNYKEKGISLTFLQIPPDDIPCKL